MNDFDNKQWNREVDELLVAIGRLLEKHDQFGRDLDQWITTNEWQRERDAEDDFSAEIYAAEYREEYEYQMKLAESYPRDSAVLEAQAWLQKH